jgi:tRNA 2-selenouridine synthase
MTAASPHLCEPLGILPFAAYARVIDARSPQEYAEDHLPGAINWPVVDDDEYAQVGTRYKTDREGALAFGATLAYANMQRYDEAVQGLRTQDDRPVLVYCYRGGKRSRAWGDRLLAMGFEPARVHVLAGGWKRYRQWVRDSLESLPPKLSFRVIAGATGSGKTRMVHALRDVGEQTVDLEGLAQHRGSLLGDLPGLPQPTQKAFDSMLLQALMALDPKRCVWVESESKKIGRLQLPDALCAAMHATTPWIIDAPMHARVKLLQEDYAHYVADPVALVAQLAPLKPLVGGATLERWGELAQAGQVDTLFEALMVDHYDPCYLRTSTRAYAQHAAAPRLQLSSLDTTRLREVARDLAS